jgi:probable rRNA maturation factor
VPARSATTSPRRRRAPRPPLLVRRTLRPAAPGKPSVQTLARLFRAAWKLVPPNRRPRRRGRPWTVALVVMDDAEIGALNRAHLGRAGPTDVLAFPMGEYDPERKTWLLGEIAVSFETAAREAAARGLPCEQELARYAVHGFLHLVGYLDDTAARRRELERVQEAALRKIHGPSIPRRGR